MPRAYVEVFADVVCPFAHVGLRRFVEFREANGYALPVLRVRAWPLELVNGALLDTARSAQHIDELREEVSPTLFGGFNRDAPPTSSMAALALVAAAYLVDDVAGERVSLAVRDAFFERGLDIADEAVLDEIASAESVIPHSLDTELVVLDDFAEGKRRGVRGSPEFFVNGQGWYCPSLHIEKVGDRLDIEPDIDSIEAFLAACFA